MYNKDILLFARTRRSERQKPSMLKARTHAQAGEYKQDALYSRLAIMRFSIIPAKIKEAARTERKSSKWKRKNRAGARYQMLCTLHSGPIEKFPWRGVHISHSVRTKRMPSPLSFTIIIFSLFVVAVDGHVDLDEGVAKSRIAAHWLFNIFFNLHDYFHKFCHV